MPCIEYKHFVCDLDVSHAITVNEFVDLSDHGLRAPEAVAIHAIFVARYKFTTLERRLNAAETAAIRTSQRRIESSVWLTSGLAKAMPVVGPITVHWQEVPCHPGHLSLQISNERRSSTFHNMPVLPVVKISHLAVVGALTVLYGS